MSRMIRAIWVANYLVLVSFGQTVFPSGPLPAADAPVAAAVDPGQRRIYVVHRQMYSDIKINDERMPTNRVSVVDQTTGSILTAIQVGKSLQGAGQGIAVDAARNLVWVTNADEDTVSMIDGSANSVVNTVPVSREPLGVAVDSSAGLVYVAGSSGSSVTILDAASGTLLGNVPLPGGAYSVALDPATHLAYVTVNAIPWTVFAVDGRSRSITGKVELPFLYTLKGIAVDPGSKAYAADYNSGSIAVIDISGGKLRELNRFSAGLYPTALAVDPSTHLVYVAETGDNRVSVFRADGAKVKAIDVLRMPTSVVIDSAANRAYVTDTLSDSLTALDTKNQTLSANFPLGNLSFGIALDSAAGRVYAANFAADAVSVVNAGSHKMMASWTAGTGPWSLAVDPALEQLYVLNSGEDTLSVISSATGTLKSKVKVGRANAGLVAVSAMTHQVYVSGGSVSASSLTVLDGTTNRVVATVDVGSQPVGVAIDDDNGVVYVASHQAGVITALDATTNKVLATWQPPLANVWGIATDPGVGALYITVPPNTIADFKGIEVLDSSTGEYLGQIPTGSLPSMVAVNRRLHHVYVSDFVDGTLGIYDGTNGNLLTIVNTGRGAHGLAVDQDSSLVYVASAFDGTITVVEDTW